MLGKPAGRGRGAACARAGEGCVPRATLTARPRSLWLQQCSQLLQRHIGDQLPPLRCSPPLACRVPRTTPAMRLVPGTRQASGALHAHPSPLPLPLAPGRPIPHHPPASLPLSSLLHAVPHVHTHARRPTTRASRCSSTSWTTLMAPRWLRRWARVGVGVGVGGLQALYVQHGLAEEAFAIY